MSALESALPEGELPRPRYRKALLRLAVSALVFALVFHFADLSWAKIRAGLASVGAVHWVGALLGFLALHALGALKWRLFLSIAGAELRRGEALRFYAAGLFSNLCLPSLVGGDAVRAGLAMTRARSKAAVLFGGAVDRLFDLVALGGLVAIGALLAPDALERMEAAEDPVSPWHILGLFFALLFVGVAGVALVFKLRPPETWPVLSEKGQSVQRALRAVRSRPGTAAFGLLLCLVIQAGFVALNAWLADGMRVGLDFALWYLLFPLAKIAAMMPFSLGGIGVREAALAILVTPFGEEVKHLAVAQSLVWETVLVAGGVIAGLFWVAGGARRGAGTPRGEEGTEPA